MSHSPYSRVVWLVIGIILGWLLCELWAQFCMVWLLEDIQDLTNSMFGGYGK